ncbi:site-specific integrase [Gluconobacter roseus]|uniref:site-specific integrase n=1 Tax=Gluconobacter roseus TaxID=586239 RepID=UPI0022327482|nr:site-specific integrase [Gluconobacter roseus]
MARFGKLPHRKVKLRAPRRMMCQAAALSGFCDFGRGKARSTPHGLRKAATRRLAEAGYTTHQIAAIAGHQSLSEVARYIRAAK